MGSSPRWTLPVEGAGARYGAGIGRTGGGPPAGGRVSLALAMALAGIVVLPAGGNAQEPPSPSPNAAEAAPDVSRGGEEPDRATSGFTLLGRPAHRTRLIGGLWTLHPFAVSWPRVEETYGYGLLWDGFFAATFVNSFGGRAVTAGVERVWFEPAWRWLALGLGYRAGLVTGYDERLISWADDVPAVPVVGLQAWARVGPARFDAFYVYRVITLELALEFW